MHIYIYVCKYLLANVCALRQWRHHVNKSTTLSNLDCAALRLPGSPHCHTRDPCDWSILFHLTLSRDCQNCTPRAPQLTLLISFSHHDRHFKRSSAFEPLSGGTNHAGYHNNFTYYHDTRSLTSLKSDPYRFYYTIDRRFVCRLCSDVPPSFLSTSFF